MITIENLSQRIAVLEEQIAILLKCNRFEKVTNITKRIFKVSGSANKFINNLTKIYA